MKHPSPARLANLEQTVFSAAAAAAGAEEAVQAWGGGVEGGGGRGRRTINAKETAEPRVTHDTH